jgi:YD repeat-containing protein
MANTILHKRSSVEEKQPQASALSLGELAVNLHDGNIYMLKSDNTVTQMKRLDERLGVTDVTNMIYDTNDNLTEVQYVTGNKTTLHYDTNYNLISVYYYATDGTTHLYTQSLNYDNYGNMLNTSWTVI